MPTYTATLRYSLPLARKVASYYTMRQFGRTTVFCAILLAVGMCLALFFGYRSELLEIVGLSVAGSLGIYFWYQREVLRRWTAAMVAMGKPEAQLTVDDEAFSISSGAGSATFPWRRFSNLWKQNDYWLLFMGGDHMPMTIPLEGLDPDLLRLIEEKIGAPGKSLPSSPAP
jgi:hypothetical protein